MLKGKINNLNNLVGHGQCKTRKVMENETRTETESTAIEIEHMTLADAHKLLKKLEKTREDIDQALKQQDGE